MSTYVFAKGYKDEMITPTSDECYYDSQDIYVWEWNAEKGIYMHVARGCRDGRYYIDGESEVYYRVDLEELAELANSLEIY